MICHQPEVGVEWTHNLSFATQLRSFCVRQQLVESFDFWSVFDQPWPRFRFDLIATSSICFVRSSSQSNQSAVLAALLLVTTCQSICRFAYANDAQCAKEVFFVFCKEWPQKPVRSLCKVILYKQEYNGPYAVVILPPPDLGYIVLFFVNHIWLAFIFAIIKMKHFSAARLTSATCVDLHSLSSSSASSSSSSSSCETRNRKSMPLLVRSVLVHLARSPFHFFTFSPVLMFSSCLPFIRHCPLPFCGHDHAWSPAVYTPFIFFLGFTLSDTLAGARRSTERADVLTKATHPPPVVGSFIIFDFFNLVAFSPSVRLVGPPFHFQFAFALTGSFRRHLGQSPRPPRRSIWSTLPGAIIFASFFIFCLLFSFCRFWIAFARKLSLSRFQFASSSSDCRGFPANDQPSSFYSDNYFVSKSCFSFFLWYPSIQEEFFSLISSICSILRHSRGDFTATKFTF